jgi:anion-transporting  ArsA/GET3 family ATPase
MKVKSVFSKVDPLVLIDKWLHLTAQIIEMLRTDTRAWVVANPEPLPVAQALDITASLEEFKIGVNGFILNKMLPLEICEPHPFWLAKYEAQQGCRRKLCQSTGDYTLKEIPELAGRMKVDGFLGDVAKLLY